MTRAILAAQAALLLGLAAPPQGAEVIDFGSALPGHDYHYVAWFRNTTGQALSIAQEGTRCGGCPSLMLQYRSLGPGDSADLAFHYRLPADAPDTTSQPVQLTVYQSGYSERTYRLRFDRRPPRLVRLSARTIGVQAGEDGLVRGSVAVANRSGRMVTVSPEGAPAGISFEQAFPLAIGRKQEAAVSFWCLPEALTNHRSLTLRISRADGGITERVSLPLVPE